MLSSGIIRKGTSYKLSRLGYYNFQYPDDATYQLKHDVAAQPISWMSFGGLKACIVSISNLVNEIKETTITLRPETGNGTAAKFSVIWIDPDNEFFKAHQQNTV